MANECRAGAGGRRSQRRLQDGTAASKASPRRGAVRRANCDPSWRSPLPPVVQVLVVRTDLGMGKGKAAAQCCHACLAAYVESTQRNPQAVEAWEEGGQAKVTLKGESEEELYVARPRAASVSRPS